MIGGTSEGRIVEWFLSNGAISRNFSAHSNQVNALEFIQDDFLASAGSDWLINLWNLTNNTLLGTLAGHDASVLSLTTFPGIKLFVHFFFSYNFRIFVKD